MDIVLAAQRVHTYAITTDVAGGHGEVGDADHHGRALAVLGHPKAIVDGGVAAGGEEARSATDLLGGHAGYGFHGFGRVLRLADEVTPHAERIVLAAGGHKRLVDQPFGGHHVRQGIDDGDVGARLELQVVVGLVVRTGHALGDAWVDHDQLGALAQATLHLRGEHRVTGRRVGADDHDDV